MNKPCETCSSKPARYQLTLTENVYCPHCNYLKYKAGKETMTICDLHCPYWTPDNCKYDSINKKIEVTYCMEKDECNNCGQRDFPEALFKGSKIIAHNCQYCNKEARYELELDGTILCPHCNVVKFPNKMKLFLCSTQCDQLDWSIVEYLTTKKEAKTELIYALENHKCENCGNKDDCLGHFKGMRNEN